jgi:CRISPR/Cas system-associated endonuclease Cas3-HD
VASVTAVNIVSSLVSPIAAEQKLLRQDMREIHQEMTQNQKEMRQEMREIHQEMTQNQKEMRQEMTQNQKEMRQEMTQNQKEMLLAVSKIDDKYAMHGERLAKLE